MTLDFDDEMCSKASSATDDATLLNQTTTGEAVAKPVMPAPLQQATFCTGKGYKAGCTLTSYYYFAGQRVAMRVQSDANATVTVTWLHGDMLGSASVATDASGNKIAGSDTRYMPFGEPRPGLAGSGLPTDRRYTGQISIAGGLIDMNARALDPVLGRFISADTIVPNPADPQTLNRFSYARNSPLNRTDPSGHADCNIHSSDPSEAWCRPVSHTGDPSPQQIVNICMRGSGGLSCVTAQLEEWADSHRGYNPDLEQNEFTRNALRGHMLVPH